MPMSFPNMQSLINRASQRNFRKPHEGEEENEYRAAFAFFMRDVDIVESLEIADGRGWNAQGPLALMQGLMQAKPELKAVVDDLMQAYPHLMITAAGDAEPIECYFGDEAQTMIAHLETFMATTPVVREVVETDAVKTTTEIMSAAASRSVVSKMLHSVITEKDKGPMQELANILGSRVLIEDVKLTITTVRKIV